MADGYKGPIGWVQHQYEYNWRWLIVWMWLIYVSLSLFGIPVHFSILGYTFDHPGYSKLIHAFALSDTDDNLRMAQVRAWLGGQGWYDLVQHRFDPAHGGANIHWSRLVDLPIAGLILLLKPFLGIGEAERWAAGIAPLLPLLVLMFALAVTMRRLVFEKAWAIPLIAMLSANFATAMFAPLRIDHHGWQLAFLGWAVAGIADPRRARGGVTLGVATGLSLIVGMEMLIYLALLGGFVVLMWVDDRDQRERMSTYAASLVATTTAGFLLFASNANWIPVCDALSPVWLSDALVGGAVMLGLSWIGSGNWKIRLAAALVAGAVVAAFHALSWPHCLQRLEGVSPAADQLWLSHVREARPFYRFDWRMAALAPALGVTALAGWAIMINRARKRGPDGRDLLRRTLAVALVAIVALLLLLWQMRAAPAAQMLAVVGAGSLAAYFAKDWLDSPKLWLHGVAALLVLVSVGALVPVITMVVPTEKKTAMAKRVDRANGRCPTLAALAPVGRQPKGMIFTFIDLGPRLIVATHHDVVGGPYHRNYPMIVDVMSAFRGDEAQAHRIIDEYRSDYLLICPDMATATIFMAETPKGFYAQLAHGKVPAWLTPVDLGKNSPFRMWKVTR